tara:strand:- start:1223 stop:1423 length:201 start_codon:yes stop_codon:yes gene_type:complete
MLHKMMAAYQECLDIADTQLAEAFKNGDIDAIRKASKAKQSTLEMMQEIEGVQSAELDLVEIFSKE